MAQGNVCSRKAFAHRLLYRILVMCARNFACEPPENAIFCCETRLSALRYAAFQGAKGGMSRPERRLFTMRNIYLWRERRHVSRYAVTFYGFYSFSFDKMQRCFLLDTLLCLSFKSIAMCHCCGGIAANHQSNNASWLLCLIGLISYIKLIRLIIIQSFVCPTRAFVL